MRIVSLDYCSDQFVLKLVDRERVLAISPDAVKDFSYMRDAAVGYPSVRPRAEEVLALHPDLIVRSYGGGPQAVGFFERAGIPVLQVGYAPDIETIKSVITNMGEGLDEPERAAAVVAEMEARLAAIEPHPPGTSVLYMTPSGFTSGEGSLVHEMILAAGLENFQDQPGWRSLPLERLAYEHPDRVAAAFFGSFTNHPDAWSPMRHPIARAQLRERPSVGLEGAWTSCSGWFILDAIEALSAQPEGGDNE
ncbi:ABC transporter substrate-binding protein [Woodsholea maritima]|uniref:ABC transporter substrate-binding protein n=1 Tax=Woodsholea maritima TaxID=240237 RepID=UPI0003A02771|nr:ABC transporter substrate-binding protein [Woodsholea maritima]